MAADAARRGQGRGHRPPLSPKRPGWSHPRPEIDGRRKQNLAYVPPGTSRRAIPNSESPVGESPPTVGAAICAAKPRASARPAVADGTAAIRAGTTRWSWTPAPCGCRNGIGLSTTGSPDAQATPGAGTNATPGPAHSDRRPGPCGARRTARRLGRRRGTFRISHLLSPSYSRPLRAFGCRLVDSGGPRRRVGRRSSLDQRILSAVLP